MRSKLLETPSGFSDALTALASETHTILWFCSFWPFLAKYMATLADRVTKLERAQVGYGTRKEAKFSQNQGFRPDPSFWTLTYFLVTWFKSVIMIQNKVRALIVLYKPTEFRISRVERCRDIAHWIFIRFRSCHILRGRCSRTKPKIKNRRHRKFRILFKIYQKKFIRFS